MSALSFADPQSQPLPLLLIVEDHADTRQMYAEFFTEQFHVLQAGDGSQALDVMDARRPDIVITDLSLPGIDGFELAHVRIVFNDENGSQAIASSVCTRGHTRFSWSARSLQAVVL